MAGDGWGQMFFDQTNAPAGIDGINMDTPEGKRAEQAMRESEAFARKVLASSLSGLYIFDLPGRVISCISPQYTCLTGYTLDHLHAMSSGDFRPSAK